MKTALYGMIVAALLSDDLQITPGTGQTMGSVRIVTETPDCSARRIYRAWQIESRWQAYDWHLNATNPRIVFTPDTRSEPERLRDQAEQLLEQAKVFEERERQLTGVRRVYDECSYLGEE